MLLLFSRALLSLPQWLDITVLCCWWALKTEAQGAARVIGFLKIVFLFSEYHIRATQRWKHAIIFMDIFFLWVHSLEREVRVVAIHIYCCSFLYFFFFTWPNFTFQTVAHRGVRRNFLPLYWWLSMFVLPAECCGVVSGEVCWWWRCDCFLVSGYCPYTGQPSNTETD